MRSEFLALACACAAVAGTARAENALHFDGSNDRVTLPLPPVFTNSEASDFTIETWLSQPASPGAFGRVVFAQSASGNVVTVAETTGGVVYL